jgi:hypothetical protein
MEKFNHTNRPRLAPSGLDSQKLCFCSPLGSTVITQGKNMKSKIFIHAAHVLILLALTSISALAGQDSVKIISLTPGNDKPLYAGSTVSIKVEVEYSLHSANTASLRMIVQRAESGHKPLANEVDVVLKGTGTLKLAKEIKIPDTRALQIFMPLTPEGAQITTTVDSRMYKVLKK